MRRPALCLASVVIAACTLALPGCGDEPAAEQPKPYRETIDPERTAEVAKRKLEHRDEALGVGATAPVIEAVAVKDKPMLVVFYRGHW